MALPAVVPLTCLVAYTAFPDQVVRPQPPSLAQVQQALAPNPGQPAGSAAHAVPRPCPGAARYAAALRAAVVCAPRRQRVRQDHAVAERGPRRPPLVQPDLTSAGATRTCDWWFFNSAIVLDTTGVYASPTSTADGVAQWYHFLHLLRRCRPLQPINGLLLTIGADTLAVQSEAALRQEAVQFRQRLDEAQRAFNGLSGLRAGDALRPDRRVCRVLRQLAGPYRR